MEMKELIWSEEIYSLLPYLKKQNSKITLWQSPAETQGRIYTGACLQVIDYVNDILTFVPKNGIFKFNSRSALYFVSMNRVVLIKMKIFYNSPVRILTKIPPSVMLREEREAEREYFRKNIVTIDYLYGENIRHWQDDRYMRAQLIDISDMGVSFKINKSNLVRFKVGESIFIKTDTSAPRKGIIKYVTEEAQAQASQYYWRVGIAFQDC